ALLALALIAALPFVFLYLRSAPVSHLTAVRAMIPPPENAHLLYFNNMAVSPDGLRLAVVAIGANGVQSLWMRPLGASSAQPLAGTEGASLPFWSPDSRFLYRAGVTSAYARDKGNDIYLGSLDSSEYKLILNDDTYAIYASGHLLFWRDGALMAQPFDAQSLQLSGEAVPIPEQVQMNLTEIKAVFSASENGVLVFQSGSSRVGSGSQLTWFERDGKQAGKLGEPVFGASPRISPDGQRVAAILFDLQAGSTDLWLYDSALTRKTRFTFDPAFDSNPIWSPDGNR